MTSHFFDYGAGLSMEKNLFGSIDILKKNRISVFSEFNFRLRRHYQHQHRQRLALRLGYVFDLNHSEKNSIRLQISAQFFARKTQ